MSTNGLKIFRNVVVHRFSPLLPKKFFLSSLNSLALMQKRSIVHKNSLKLDEETYPEPWPYKEKGFHFILHYYDFFFCLKQNILFYFIHLTEILVICHNNVVLTMFCIRNLHNFIEFTRNLRISNVN